jgi:hypothetical protein
VGFPAGFPSLGFGRRNYSLDRLFLLWNYWVLSWAVEYTDEFEAWWDSLTEEEQDEIDTVVELLEEHGPTLSRPYADVITSSRHSNMKELRGKVGARLRVLFAFDPRRTALLLIGGDKTGDPKWYQRFVPIADDLFDRHLEQLRKKPLN